MYAIGADEPKETIERARAVLQRKRHISMTLTERDGEIVRWIHLAGLGTREQTQKLFFGPGSRSRCQERLTLLYRNHYVDKLPERAVNTPDVYYLSRRSRNALRLLRASGLNEPIVLYRPNPVKLQHTIEVLDCRVQITSACNSEDFSLLHWLNEDELMPLTNRFALLPDAYFQIARATAEGEKRSAFFLEVERSGKSERSLKEKFRRYGEFYYGGTFEKQFGTRALRVLVLLSADFGLRPEQRVEKCCHLAEELGVTFLRFAALSTFAALTPKEVFSTSLWRRPGDGEMSPLFGG